MKVKRETPNDVDRGWAWVVMGATYMGMIVYCVPLYMSGVLYVALLERYGQSEAKTSLVGAISTGLLCFAAPVGGVLNNKYNCRVSIVLGGLLTSVGFFTSAFVPDLNWMILTSGVLVGLGYGISSSGLICVLGFSFEKWRDQVISGAFLGVGVAMFLSAPSGLYLITNHGFTMSMSILGCIQAQMCVLGMFCKPSPIEIKVKRTKQMTESGSKFYIDVSLLLNKAYALYLCSTASWNFGLCVAIMHLPNYVTKLGGDSSNIGWLMTAFSVSNLTGRLCGLLTVSKFHGNSIRVHATVLGITGVLTSLLLVYSSLPGAVYIFAIQLGIFTGWPNGMMTPMSLSFVGVEKLSEAYGLAFLACGLGVTTGPILIGYLYDVTLSYEYSFIVAGAVLVTGCFCATGAICCKNDNKEKQLELYVDDQNEMTKVESVLENDNLLSDTHITCEINGIQTQLNGANAPQTPGQGLETTALMKECHVTNS